MTIRVQLWNDQNCCISEDKFDTEVQADQKIDQLITSVHALKFGGGTFEIFADYVDHDTIFVGAYWRRKIDTNCSLVVKPP